ncbi:hypothetical protein PTE30175_02383 [Pandoraea terrae]|uniref:Uncharacterized protein n=1 Tax=Pandoraea terrae TaxID=1537710 RepID=A0A5E4V8J9_9BURK|nr:hypothetical protein [Pandoraea terrae]VVE07375.1 hypothetical protein PTE30175_02383 [Pandoraea terrae]
MLLFASRKYSYDLCPRHAGVAAAWPAHRKSLGEQPRNLHPELHHALAGISNKPRVSLTGYRSIPSPPPAGIARNQGVATHGTGVSIDQLKRDLFTRLDALETKAFDAGLEWNEERAVQLREAKETLSLALTSLEKFGWRERVKSLYVGRNVIGKQGTITDPDRISTKAKRFHGILVRTRDSLEHLESALASHKQPNEAEGAAAGTKRTASSANHLSSRLIEEARNEIPREKRRKFLRAALQFVSGCVSVAGIIVGALLLVSLPVSIPVIVIGVGITIALNFIFQVNPALKPFDKGLGKLEALVKHLENDMLGQIRRDLVDLRREVTDIKRKLESVEAQQAATATNVSNIAFALNLLLANNTNLDPRITQALQIPAANDGLPPIAASSLQSGLASVGSQTSQADLTPASTTARQLYLHV